MTAGEAKECGLVTEVFAASQLQAEVWPRLQELAKLPMLSLVYGKKLVQDLMRDELKKVTNTHTNFWISFFANFIHTSIYDHRPLTMYAPPPRGCGCIIG